VAGTDGSSIAEDRADLRSATMPEDAVPTVVACEECGRVWLEGERGWEAHRLDEDPTPLTRALLVDERMVAFYCPKCAEREFGE
jgi:hypothetical protein